jgi:hypothetical protein
MSDLGEQLREAFASRADTTAVEYRTNLSSPVTVAAPPKSWKPIIAVAAVTVAIMVAGLALLSRSTADEQVPATVPPPSTSDGISDPEMINVGAGWEVPVVGEPVTVNGVTVYQGAPAPELEVDPETVVGDAADLALEPIEPGDFPVPDELVGDVDVLVTVGRIGSVAMAVHASDSSGAVCVLRVLIDDPAGLWVSGCSSSSTYGSGVAGTALSWPTLPSETALVVEEDADGTPQRYQLPIANAVVFTPADEGTVLVAYDAAGGVLDRTVRPVDSSDLAAGGLAESAALNWVNMTGLNQNDAEVWADRLDDICTIPVNDTERIRELADEYVSADLTLIRAGSTFEPSADDGVRALELIIQSVCSSKPGGR